jgi:ferritin-like metal-binding protein YciE
MGSHLRGVQPTSNICANEKTGSMALKDVLVDELSDMYSAENRLVKALPNLAEGAKSPTLKSLFTVHLDATKGRVERLKQIFVLRDKKPTGEHCNGGSGFKEDLSGSSADSPGSRKGAGRRGEAQVW